MENNISKDDFEALYNQFIMRFSKDIERIVEEKICSILFDKSEE